VPVDIKARARRTSATQMGTTRTHGDCEVVDGGWIVEALVSALAPRRRQCDGRVSSGEVPSWTASAGTVSVSTQSAGIRGSKKATPSGHQNSRKVCRSRTGEKVGAASTPTTDSTSISRSNSITRPSEDSQVLPWILDQVLPARSKAPRTFGFMRDLESLRARNLASAATWTNAVLDDYRILNE